MCVCIHVKCKFQICLGACTNLLAEPLPQPSNHSMGTSLTRIYFACCETKSKLLFELHATWSMIHSPSGISFGKILVCYAAHGLRWDHHLYQSRRPRPLPHHFALDLVFAPSFLQWHTQKQKYLFKNTLCTLDENMFFLIFIFCHILIAFNK